MLQCNIYVVYIDICCSVIYVCDILIYVAVAGFPLGPDCKNLPKMREFGLKNFGQSLKFSNF